MLYLELLTPELLDSERLIIVLLLNLTNIIITELRMSMFV